MIIRVFRENQTFVLLLSFILSILLWVFVGNYKPYEPDYQTFFNTALFHLFPGLKTINQHRLFCSGINITLIFIIGIYASRLLYKYQLLKRRSLLPLVIFFILCLPYFTVYSGLSYPLITLIPIMRVIDILFASVENQKIAYGYFDSALLISLISILNFYSIFLFGFLVYVLLQFKGPKGREFIFILLGLVIPYLIFLSILYLFNLDISSFLQSYKLMFSMKTVLTESLLFYITGIFTMLLVLISSLKMMNNFIKMKIVTRKYSVVFFGLFVASILIALFYPIADRDILFYLALPLTYLFGVYFATCQINLINHILFLLLVTGNFLVLIYR